MDNKAQIQNKKSIVQNCHSTHLIVVMLRAEKHYTTPSDSDYDVVILAKCPITGKFYNSNGSSWIRGKHLHFINDKHMDYTFIKCELFDLDFKAKYESWDDIANIIAKDQGLKNPHIIKEIIKDTVSYAKFEEDKLECVPVKKKTLLNIHIR